MKKPVAAGGSPAPATRLAVSAFAVSYPTLHEWMSTQTWEDGTARATTTLFLFVDQGVLKAMLKDRDAGQVAFASAEALDDLLGHLEERLKAGTVEWKVDRPPAGRGRK